MTPLRADSPTSIVTALPLDDGGCVVLDEFLDDSDTIAVVTPHLTPEMLRLVADAVSQTVERIASDFERINGGRAVQMSTLKVAARVRSMQALARRAA